MNRTAAERLEKAADILETEGWCRGQFEDKNGHHCAQDALQAAGREFAALNEQWSSATVYGAVDAQLRAEGWDTGIINYNDEQRDKRKVIRLLRRTARNLRTGRLIYAA